MKRGNVNKNGRESKVKNKIKLSVSSCRFIPATKIFKDFFGNVNSSRTALFSIQRGNYNRIIIELKIERTTLFFIS